MASSGISEDALRSITYPEGATFIQVQELSAERRAVYAAAMNVQGSPGKPLEYSAALPDFDKGNVAAVLCDDSGQKVQYLVHAPDDGPPTVVMLGCKILMEDLSPTQMVEYRFQEGGWMLSGMGSDACEMYRGSKWSSWQKMWKEPDCKAALVRMVQAGLVNKLYDPYFLPTPQEDLAAWMVTDEKTGKITQIAHPVAALRMWDAGAGEFQDITALLDGAPADADVPAVWEEMLNELKAKYIDIDGEVISGTDLVCQALA